ncbi:FAD-dependent oxidoreductase [Metapseudomonas resinovorans]|uniref:3-oxosteroid 1-dehydrogenase n=2 Tax=Metapseudomonas resinovorans TaxID=53412 RepID=S6ASE2_METRE|nr:FAD-dependent oxidoreductase [Pseudomonas resinovorans]BAH79701.1 3-oxosteroid-delta-1-dehydrogenase [Pseudomonas resinovorans]BAN46966.1 3-ketosteroid-delta1-dehydrogenase [Pseudomonas resinovorans NBRC 106553]
MSANGLQWDESCDVLVVGSGAGAMTAALRARDLGSEVLVVEKSDRYGGTSAVSGGGIWVPCNHRIEALGGHDSAEEAIAYIRAVTRGEIDDGRIEAYVEQGHRVVRYLEQCSRVRFEAQPRYADYYPEVPGGKPGFRSMDPLPFDARLLGDEFARMREPSPGTLMMGRMTMTMAEAQVLLCRGPGWLGLTLKILWRYWRDLPGRLRSRRDRFLTLGNALVGALRRSLMERDVPLWLNCQLQRLIEEDGRVVGAELLREGRTLRVRARRGVVLGAGGFERNQAMRSQYHPQPSRSDWSATPPFNTGDAIRAGQALGAATALMDHSWWAPTTHVQGEEKQRALFVERTLPGCIMVNSIGERFVNEAAPYTDIVYAMYDNNREGASSVPCWLVFDAEFRRKYPCGALLPGYAMPDSRLPARLHGYFHKADSLLELAGRIGVDPAGLLRTVERFNLMAEAGRDEDFHKGESLFDRYYGDPTVTPNPCLAPLLKAPFYAVKVDAGDIGTKGGLLTDVHARVLREDGSPIAGLYAIGNSAASMMGRTYPGAGSTIGPAMVFGFLAAGHIHAEKSGADGAHDSAGRRAQPLSRSIP